MSHETTAAIASIYQETKDFLIIGLTGRTGSGCTTAADKLTSSSLNIPGDGYDGLTENELKKHRIIKRYNDSSDWVPFYKIEVSGLITFHLLLLSAGELGACLRESLIAENTVASVISKFESDYAVVRSAAVERIKYKFKFDRENAAAWYALYFEDIPAITRYLRNALTKSEFTNLYQRAGDNVRASGCANNSEFKADEIFSSPGI